MKSFLATRAVTYQSERVDICLTVSEADIALGNRRYRLYDAVQPVGEQDETDPDALPARLHLYPPLVAAVVAVDRFRLDGEDVPFAVGGKGLPLDPEVFVRLPERLMDAWFAAVRELNPHWWSPARLSEEAEKKDSAKATLPTPG